MDALKGEAPLPASKTPGYGKGAKVSKSMSNMQKLLLMSIRKSEKKASLEKEMLPCYSRKKAFQQGSRGHYAERW
jgi:hypothetical protein